MKKRKLKERLMEFEYPPATGFRERPVPQLLPGKWAVGDIVKGPGVYPILVKRLYKDGSAKCLFLSAHVPLRPMGYHKLAWRDHFRVIGNLGKLDASPTEAPDE